jgi:hypothetical protein
MREETLHREDGAEVSSARVARVRDYNQERKRGFMDNDKKEVRIPGGVLMPRSDARDLSAGSIVAARTMLVIQQRAWTAVGLIPNCTS